MLRRFVPQTCGTDCDWNCQAIRGMGEVYRAFDARPECIAAIIRLKDEQTVQAL